MTGFGTILHEAFSSRGGVFMAFVYFIFDLVI